MPRGYRCIILAAFGGLILIGAAPKPAPVAQADKPDTQQAIANALNQIAATGSEQAQRAESSRETEPCKAGEDKRYSDLCAQWKAADAAQLAAYLNLASIATVLIALYLAFRSNWIARDTAKRQLRAYLTVDEFIWNIDKGDYKVQISFVNRGQTPAYNVDASANWIALDAPMPHDFVFSAGNAHVEDGPAVIGPNQNIFGVCDIPLGEHTMLDAAAGAKHVYVWGHVSYTDAFASERLTRVAVKIHVERLPKGVFGLRWNTLHGHNEAT